MGSIIVLHLCHEWWGKINGERIWACCEWAKIITEARQDSTALPATLTAPSTYFDDIPDPRVDRTKQHLLKDILVITILAAIAGAQGWEDIENYALSKQQWAWRIFRVTQWHPQRWYISSGVWKARPESFRGEIIAMVATNYGFSLPRNSSHRWQKSARFLLSRERFKKLTLVTAWASGQRLVLGQVKVEDHSNEITAIPALLGRRYSIRYWQNRVDMIVELRTLLNSHHQEKRKNLCVLPYAG